MSQKPGKDGIRADELKIEDDELALLQKRVVTLEDELKRKQGEIERIRKENDLLFKTALKAKEQSLKSSKKDD